MRARGRFYDGRSAARHDVEVFLDRAGRLLVIEGAHFEEAVVWPLDDVRLLADQPAGGGVTFAKLVHGEDELQRGLGRLTLNDATMNGALRQSVAKLETQERQSGALRRVALYTASAVAALALVLFVILPAMAGSLAPMIPREREVQFGKAVVRQMSYVLNGGSDEDLTCETPKGRAALDKLVARLSEGQGLEYRLDVQVMDHEMVNAFAAPGGQIVILSGLLKASKNVDQLAGVLAHEIGHVENRDVTRNALRAAGSAGLLSMVLGDVSGGTLAVFLAESAVSARYTRKAEAAADDFALEMLRKAGIGASGLAGFFEYMQELEGDDSLLPRYLLSHPPSGERADKARAQQDVVGAEPVLSDDEWASLRMICNSSDL